MDTEQIAAERMRAHALLAGLGMTWTEEAVVPGPADLGAVDGFRLVSADGKVRLNIYVYEHWGEGAEPGQALTEMVAGDEYHAGSTVNGRLMCFAVTPADSPSGRELLDEALGAVAGIE